MKPVRLNLTAFGSYPGEEFVDFEALSGHGLFVVTGPTGSGKSTLFDAMTFALYGTVPGDRLDHVRSHHARPDAITGVDLTFDTSEGRFCVRRTAKYERAKQRGTGVTTVQATAALYRVVSDGSLFGRLEPMASRPQEVNRRCEELVGLSAQQFQRVVLLPQGQCAEFLMAETAARRGLLQQLFGTHLYERATTLARDRVAAQGVLLDECERNIDGHRRSAAGAVTELRRLLGTEADAGADSPERDNPAADTTIEHLRARLDQFAPLVDHHRVATEAAAAEVERLHTLHLAADHDAQRWDRRLALLARAAVLDTDRDAAETADRRRIDARRAVPVIRAADDLGRAEADHRTAVDQVVDGRRRLLRDAAGAGVPGTHDELDVTLTTPLADLMVALAAQRAELEGRLGDVRRLAEAEAEVERLGRAAGSATNELRRLEAEVERHHTAVGAISGELAVRSELARTIDGRAAVAKAAGHLITMRREWSELSSQADVATAAAADADATLHAVRNAFLASVAPHLAASLVDGDPCPVCGSAEHPAPAHQRTTDAVGRDELDAAQRRRDERNDRLNKVILRLAHQFDQLGDHATTDMAILLADQRRATALLHEAHEAEIDVQRLDLQRAQTEKAIAEADDELPGVRTRHHRAQADLDRAVAGVADSREQLGARDPREHVAELDRRMVRLRDATNSASRIGRLEQQRDAHQGAVGLAQRQVTTILGEQGFDDEESAVAVALAPDELARLEHLVDTWRRDRHDVDGRLAALAADGPLPDERPDVDTAAGALIAVRHDVDARARRQAQLDMRLDHAVAELAAARQLHDATVELRAGYETAQTVFAVCNGDNSRRVQLETWVLAGELDRVTDAANGHLARMTASRYTLRRDEPSGVGNRRAGLDLVVDDADTGRPRPPTTLSGGEQFQAALALALGLADVVSQGGSGSGKVYEALFIDEGFGSLDADALDEAVDALLDLRATGRMVGVITHVDTMRRQLPVGIDVVKHPGGGSTVTQPLLR